MSTKYSLTEIGHLPPELLTLVFKHVHDLGYPTSIRPGEVLDIGDRGMFGLSHVCRSWRDIMLSLGSLWASKIDVSSCHPDLNRLVMERTGSHQLDISLRNVSRPHGQENLLFWLYTPHQQRADTIDIRCFGGRLSSIILSEHIGPSLPALRSLEICICSIEHEDQDSQGSFEADEIASVKTLSVHDAPALTNIVLYNCVLLWRANLFTQLTRLHIEIDTTFSVTYGQQPTHAELRSVLTGMHQLVDLFLLYLFPHYIRMDGVPTPIRITPTCERVTLATHAIAQGSADHSNYNSTQLAVTLVPPVAAAAFNLEQSCFGELRHSLRAFAGSVRPPRALSLRTAAHPAASSVVFGFEASMWLQSPVDALISIPGRHVTITFRTEVSDDGELSAWDVQSRKDQYDKVLDALWEMDFRGLQVLRIDGLRWWGDQKQLFQERAYPFPAVQDEAPLFARARNVEVLILTAKCDVTLLEALTEMPAARNKLLFPRLHTIAMEWPRHESVSRFIIVDLFQKRHAAGMPMGIFQVLRKGGQDECWEDLLGFTKVEVHDSASE